MIRAAKRFADTLIVLVNNDNWLRAKKGYVFMPQEERVEIIKNIMGVDRVLLTNHEPDPRDMSVCRELKRLSPDCFANGGDRKPDDDPVPEVALCEELGIKMVYNVGRGGKIQSSSRLVKSAAKMLLNGEEGG